MPKLLITLPDGTSQSHDLADDLVTIGRVSDNAIQIDDASVSSHHAELRLEGNDYILRDIGSTNGTRLNGQTVEADSDHPLQAGDAVRLGQIECAYEAENLAEARPLPVEDEPDLVPAASSSRPSNFTNASPFEPKQK